MKDIRILGIYELNLSWQRKIATTLWQIEWTYSKARVHPDPPPLPAPLPYQPDLHHHLPQHLRWPQLQPDRGEIKAWYNLIYPLTKQVISSPAFINNEYLICQNLLYVNGNSSLPVYQEAEQVTDVRCQFVKVLLFYSNCSYLACPWRSWYWPWLSAFSLCFSYLLPF